MSAPSDIKSPTPESPTTARPLEMDDDDLNETNTIVTTDDTATKSATTAAAAATAATTTSGDTGSSKPAAAAAAAAATVPASASTEAEEPAPPPKPPRPLTEQQKAEQTLKDAFPTVEAPVIKAVLTASRGNVESAFHALLEMTDPSAVEQELPPPPQPPRPPMQDPQAQAAYGRLSPNSQLAADEEYARRLAMQYENEGAAYEYRTSTPYARSGSRRDMDPAYPRPHQETGLKPNEMWGEREHSFIDDDLPVIQENLRKGFVETQNKFNTWFTGIKKRIDDELNKESDDEDEGHHAGSSAGGARPGQPGRPGGPGPGRGGYGSYGSRQQGRRSGDYDADPTLLTDDFAGIQLHGDGTPVRMPNNPNVFRPPPLSTSPRPEGERKVSFRDGDEVIDMYNASPKVPSKDGLGTAATKTSKWQPMSSVDPTPIADNDPFSLGDSEDEKDTAKVPAPAAPTTAAAAATTAKADTPAADAAAKPSDEEAERLRKAAAEAMADSLVDDKPKA